MATNVGTLVVKLMADMTDLKKGLDQSGKEIQGFGNKTKAWFNDSKIAIGAAVGGISAAIVTSIKAYGEQEQAVASLNQALANQGKYSKQTSQDLQDFATQLQSVTTYGDEAIVSVQAQLVAFGLEGEELKKTTRATLDLATAKGVDLQSAAQLLGKAFVGETGTLSRYGIVLGDNIPETEKFAMALEKVNQMFGGQAETARNTTLGQLAGMKNAFSDLQEEVGAFLSSDAVGFTKWLTALITRLSTALAQIRQWAAEVGGLGNLIRQNFVLAITAVLSSLLQLATSIPGVSFLFRKLGIDVKDTQAKLEEWGVQQQVATNLARQGAVQTIAAHKAVQQEIRNTGLVHQEVNAVVLETQKGMTKDYIDNWIATKQAQVMEQSKAGKILGIAELDWAENAKSMANSVFNNFGNGVADMVLEGKRFADVMKSIWKDLARQIISYITQIIAKWLVLQALTGGKAGGLVKIAGGMAEGGMINEPSLITGIRSGRTHLAGEAGPEAVVPMKNVIPLQSTGTPEGSGGGGNITVNITGQFIEGNEATWQTLIRNKIIPEIRRLTMSNPTGLFNRRRGATA